MIVLLLSNLNSLQANNNNTSCSSTGCYTRADTAVAIIPVYLIKQANAKMIERRYLIDINKHKDSIIIMKDKYIKEQQNIIVDFQNKISISNNLNYNIKKTLDKQKRKNKIIGYSTGGIIIGLIVSLIIK
jgi:hypothetical protein